VVRSWILEGQTDGEWAWDGKDSAGKTVADGVYNFRIDGIDAAGNGTVHETPVLVDRTIAGLSWATSSFKPKARQKDQLSLKLTRSATVTVAIYQGSRFVRRIWTDKLLARGTWTWSWNGRDGHRELVGPGKYTVRVAATSWIGKSGLTRTVTVKAP
jgi:flagellar hook assembly protein FlgD